MMLNCISVFLLILLISNISIILNYIHWIPVARFTSWSCRWGQGICRSAWEMTSLVCTREFLPPKFFKTQWLWAQVGMLVLNAMNGLTRMRGTLELRRDTGAPSINKSLIVLANAFRCVHPAVRPGADLHFKPICFGKAAAATDGLTVQHISQIMLYHPLQSRNMASPSSLFCLEWHAKNFEYRMCPFILNDFVCDRCGGTAPKRQSSGCGNCGHGWVSKLLDFPAKLVSLQSYV